MLKVIATLLLVVNRKENEREKMGYTCTIGKLKDIMKFYKITTEDEKHYGMTYTDGLNVDVMPFNPSGDCKSGGIYFAREDILAFLNYGPWIREVMIPEDAKVYENPGSPKKWKADKVVLGKRRRIDTGVVRELIAEGAVVHADNDFALRWAANSGRLKIVKELLKAGADIHAKNDSALQRAAENGHLEIAKELLKAGADIHAKNDSALRLAKNNGHLKVVEELKKWM